MEALVSQLNQANPDASYSLSGAAITGTWNQSATASGTLGTDKMHMDYSVVATLNPDNTFTYIENMKSSNSSLGAGANTLGPTADQSMDNGAPVDDGGINVFSSSNQIFKGKTFGEKEMGGTFTFGGKKDSNSFTYSFDADKIKGPLLLALQAAGYAEQKKSFLKSLFGK